jgi:hypothetical protein
MFTKNKFGVALLSLLSMVTAGSKVHAAFEADLEPGKKEAPELFDTPMLLDAPVVQVIPMTPRLQQAVQKAVQDADSEKLKDGIFVIGPNGELEYLGKRSDFDKIRNEIIRLKMEKNHAGPGAGRNSNCG